MATTPGINPTAGGELIAALRKMVSDHPAEALTLLAGAVGLLAGTTLNLTQLWALVIVVAVLPALVTWAVQRARAGPARHHVARHEDFELEYEYASTRIVRKALLGDPSWQSDLEALRRIRSEHAEHQPSDGPARTAATDADEQAGT